MADSDSLKVMSIFEAGARLGCGSEILCLAAHIYHRFFKTRPDMPRFELFTFACACIKLAHHFYERYINIGDLTKVMLSVLHGPQYFLDSRDKRKKLEKSIYHAALIVTINLRYRIDYKDTRMMTPGDLLRSTRVRDQPDIIMLESSSSDEDDDSESSERLLSNNSKYQISAHRYLAHYLKSISLLITQEMDMHFKLMCNIAWTFLSDLYWSPCVIQQYPNHLSCACLMMAIETCRIDFNGRKAEKVKLWKILERKWNLIFCDDFDNEQLQRIITMIVKQYGEYDQVLEHEFNTYVIDPKKGGRNIRPGNRQTA